MSEFRIKGKDVASKYTANKLEFDESTYCYSSEQKEKEFIDSQFSSIDEKEKYKAYREEWHRRADECDSGDKPLAVICELVSSCNLKCEMCYTITEEFQEAVVGDQRMMPWEMVVRIVDECAEIGVPSMLFSWRGESTMYRVKGPDGKPRDFADALAYARKKGILEITSLTNGRIMSLELIEKMVKAQPNWLSFSIDGLEEEYGKVRKAVKTDKGCEPFELVTSNIKNIVQLRDQLGFSKPQIRTNTIFPAIAKNPIKYREFMENLGVGLVTINEILDFRGLELPDDDILDNWMCMYPFQRLVISANGTVMACPGAHNEEDDVALGRIPGGIKKRVKINGANKDIEYPEGTLMDAWNSEKLIRVRELHATNRRKEIWACKHCRHGAKKYGVKWLPDEWDMEKMQWKTQRRFRNN
ncbi:MAG: hypothetical protein CL402_00640 [Acidiferrobacteraceae bacterium]|nr:hypothetical protein [Acidiferrobacteraceae bacterium]|tara:strand:+ start:4894 stop:6135 length:1242 start_codon:yes stop_codon:yes gene_type:complete